MALSKSLSDVVKLRKDGDSYLRAVNMIIMITASSRIVQCSAFW